MPEEESGAETSLPDGKKACELDKCFYCGECPIKGKCGCAVGSKDN